MTISSTSRQAGPYAGNGVTVALPFAFKVFATTDVRVVSTNPAGVSSDMALGTQFNVSLNSDQDVSPGGTVTMIVAPSVGYSITITSQVEALQTLDLTSGGNFYPQAIENALDRSVILCQQISAIASLAQIGNPAAWASSLSASTGSSLVGFQQIGTGAVSRTVLSKLRDIVNVMDFGAVGDGVTDDTVSINYAVNSLNGKGGIVYFPATGKAYKISDTIQVPNGTILYGGAGKNFAGTTATNAQWAAAGVWLNPTHPSNPAVKLAGHGSGIIGINFLHVQPIPSGGSWTPNVYGYCIEQVGSFCTIEDCEIVNASHGIYLHYTSVSGGGTECRIRDVNLSAFQVRLRTSCMNDTAYFSNIHFRNLWYATDSRVVAYIRANTYGWYCGYTDNVIVDGMEFFEDAFAMYFVDETCLSNTHSLYNATLQNVQFGLSNIHMKVAATTTTVKAEFGTCIAQSGNAFGITWSDTAFQLGSDNVDIGFGSLVVRDAGGQLMTLGNGTGGSVSIGKLTVQNYSTIAAGQVCFSMSAGAQLQMGWYRIFKNGTAGLRFAGAGYENISTGAFGNLLFFGRLSEASLTGNGAYQDFSTSSYIRPGQTGVHQIRLLGELIVGTSQPTTTASIKLAGGLSEVTVTGIVTSSTGSKSFDSGWVDLAEATLSSLAIVGKLQVNAATGVILTSGSVQVLLR